MDKRFISFFTHSKDIFFVMDMSGVILHTNPSFRQLFNYTEAELLGINIADICHPADKERRDESVGRLVADKQLIGYQSRVKAKDGCYYSVTWSILLNDDGLIYSTGNPVVGVPAKSGPASDDIVQHTIQSLTEGFIVLDTGWNVLAFNPAFQAMANLDESQIRLSRFTSIESLGLTPRVMDELERSLTNKQALQVQYLNTFCNSWLRMNVYPYHNRLAVFIRDITEIMLQQWVLALEKKVLELNATSRYTLAQTTNELLMGIEGIFPEMICSVLEVDDAQEKLHNLAAPQLPKNYCDAIENLSVGPHVGSCGTAVFHRRQVIVSDIENDFLWADYAGLAKQFGLKACWSTPVISSKGSKVLAVFGIYYNCVREPNDSELQLIGRTVNILRVLIESKRNEENILDQNNRLQSIANISSHELRRPVATILGLVNLFDKDDILNPLNKEIIAHLDTSARELDDVIHSIVEKTLYMRVNEAEIYGEEVKGGR
ncbi:PAS domain S-box protein [Mucilaginibacter ginsenosidivorax]|uniref:histidine kinase n=1 Tax=Mucilaginibacter ginsenosidivorax TaxID=862126 RepID=A0A5B8W407_9SPHI|nr:PAS domain S-box protein [Mucilaginibacter ginsenosidivorax]QEC78463.1 PAS domain S-box protein [Mucilaginibacter ginsenosidivorax]